mgnify:CR=1 FL=1
MKHILAVTTPENNTTVYLNADLIRGVCLSEDKKTTNILFNKHGCYMETVEDIDTVLSRIYKLYNNEPIEKPAENKKEKIEVDVPKISKKEAFEIGKNIAKKTSLFQTDEVLKAINIPLEKRKEILKDLEALLED